MKFAGKWLPLVCTQNCTGAPQEVSSASGHGLEELARLAESRGAGDESASGRSGGAAPACDAGVHMLPYFTGEQRI